jgi:hypothetical protein
MRTTDRLHSVFANFAAGMLLVAVATLSVGRAAAADLLRTAS